MMFLPSVRNIQQSHSVSMAFLVQEEANRIKRGLGDRWLEMETEMQMEMEREREEERERGQLYQSDYIKRMTCGKDAMDKFKRQMTG